MVQGHFFFAKKVYFCQLVIDIILQLCYIITMNRRAVEELKMNKWIKTFDCDSYKCWKCEGKTNIEWFPTRGAGSYRVKISNDNFKRFYTLKEAKAYAETL